MSLYSDFGDVRSSDFKSWWTGKVDGTERGVRLFAEPSVEETVRVLAVGEVVTSEPDVIAVSLPMYLPKRFIEQRLKQIVGTLHQGKRGRQHAKRSKARYTYRGQPNVPALSMAYAVYQYWSVNPGKKLWEVGNAIPGLLGAQKVNEKTPRVEHALNKRVLAASVSRYIRRAKSMIANTEKGVFP
jgi:hypothetical protein